MTWGSIAAWWLVAASILAGIVLWVPVGSASTWTETSQPDFLGGTLTDVSVTPGGDVSLVGSEVPALAKQGMVLDVGSGPNGTADSRWAFNPFVLRESAGTYKMWYNGYDGIRYRMLFADSPDGIVWTKRGVVIDVLTPPWNFDSVSSMSVLKEGATYHMWFTAGFWSGGPGAGGFWGQVYHATSSDGRSWSIQGPALGLGALGTWDDSTTNTPWVVRDTGGVYRLYYAGWDGSPAGTYRIGLATSATYTGFTRSGVGPIVDLGPAGAWDDLLLARPNVVMGSRWMMIYGASDGATGRGGLAFSDDAGYTWTKWTGNPWLVPDPSPAWDRVAAGSTAYVSDPAGERLYYTGGDGTNYRIGYALLSSSFVSPGTYESRVFDSGTSGTSWQTVAWGTTTPVGTAVVLSVRAGDSSPPDASWTPWTAVTGPSSGSPLTLPRSRHMQYRVELSTMNGSATPVLHDVTVTYEPNGVPSASPLSPAGGMWLQDPAPTFQWTVSDPEADPQTGFEVQVSPDPTFANYVSSGVRSGSTPLWQSPPLAEGRWNWRVRVADPFGAWSGWAAESFGIDSTPPWTVASLAGTSGLAGWYRGPVTVTLSATDATSGVAATQYRSDGGAWQLYGSGIPVTEDGAHLIEFYSTDAAGLTESTRSLAFRIDASPPSTTAFLSGQLGQNGWYGSPVAVTLVALDATSGVSSTEFRVDAGAWQAYSSPVSVTGEGTHLVEFRSEDLAGNEESEGTIAFFSDSMPPQTVASLAGTAGGGGWYISSVTVTLSASDSTSGVGVTEYRLDGGPWRTYVDPFAVGGEGAHGVEIRSMDTAGNVEFPETVSFRIDTEAPETTATLLGRRPDSRFVEHAVIDLAAADATSGIFLTEYRVDGAEWRSYADAFEITNYGTHTVEFRSTDNAGLQEATQSVTFQIETSLPTPAAPVVPWLYVFLVAMIAGFSLLAFLLARRRRQTMEPPPPEAPKQ